MLKGRWMFLHMHIGEDKMSNMIVVQEGTAKSSSRATDTHSNAAPAAASTAEHSEQQIARQLEAIVQGVLGVSIPADQPLLEVC